MINFKGIQSLTLDAAGCDTDVFGDNATGKTTTRDALTWLLFDKDSAFNSKFQIKTLDGAGQVIHELDHAVEGVFALAGKTVTLKKVYVEKWTTPRGSATKELTGHVTEYFIDGVPKKAGEYKVAVAQIASEEQFKLLTSPEFFPAVMPWKDRRRILIDICGDVTDQDVIASSDALAGLPAILNGRTMDDHRAVVTIKQDEDDEKLAEVQ
ncbi:MAG: ATP-binding protein, partial [Desulfobulbaceae bacterium]|nr:ATP-binding protein [Desulfobulbaceae bacterium]